MAQQAKFSINVRPSRLHEYPGTRMVAAEHFLQYRHDAGMAYLEKVGIPWRPSAVPVAVGWRVALTSPLRIGEELKIWVRATRIGPSSYTTEFQLNEASSGRPVATIIERGMIIDLETGRSTPWLEEDKQKVIAFEGKENIKLAGR